MWTEVSIEKKNIKGENLRILGYQCLWECRIYLIIWVPQDALVTFWLLLLPVQSGCHH